MSDLIALNLNRQEVETVLRLIDFRMSALRHATSSYSTEQKILSEVVDIIKLRMKIQEHLDRFLRKGC